MAISLIVEKILDHIYFQIFILSGEVYVLFATDIYIVGLPYSANNAIDIIKLFWFSIFCIEFILSVCFEKHYIFSFSFVVDAIDLISLSSDIDLIWNHILTYLDDYNYRNDPKLFSILSQSNFFSVSGISIGQTQMRYFSILGLIGYLKATRIAKVIEMTNKINRNVFKTKKIKKVKLRMNLCNELLQKSKRKRVDGTHEARMTMKYMEYVEVAQRPFSIPEPFEFESYIKPLNHKESQGLGLISMPNCIKADSNSSLNSSQTFVSNENNKTEDSITRRLNDSFLQMNLKTLVGYSKKDNEKIVSKTVVDLKRIEMSYSGYQVIKKPISSRNKLISNISTIAKRCTYTPPISNNQFKTIITTNSLQEISEDQMNSQEESQYENQMEKLNHFRNSINRMMYNGRFTSSPEGLQADRNSKTDKLKKSMTLSNELMSLKTVNHKIVNQYAERLILETMLQKKVTSNVVAMVLLIVLCIEMTFFNFIQDIIFIPVPNKIDSCVNSTLNLAYKAKQFLDVEGYELVNPYIPPLNRTLSLCFSNYINQDLNDDNNIFVMYINLTSFQDLLLLKDKYKVLSYIPEAFASSKYLDNFCYMNINVDYLYRHFQYQNKSIEFLIDITEFNKYDHIFNLVRTIFISVTLYFLVLRLFSDLSSFVILPTTETIDKFNLFFSRKTLGIILYNRFKDTNDRKLALISHYVDILFNKRVLRILENSEVSFEGNELYLKEGFSFKGTGLYIYFDLPLNCDLESQHLVNKILGVIHSHCFGYVGEVFEPQLIIWKASSNDFENMHFEYSKLDTTCNSYDRTKKSPEYSLEPPYCSSLSCLCIIELNFLFLNRYAQLLDRLKEKGIKMNFFVFEDDFLYGYQYIKGLSLRELIFSRIMKSLLQYAVSI